MEKSVTEEGSTQQAVEPPPVVVVVDPPPVPRLSVVEIFNSNCACLSFYWQIK
jgi:hypothetical protein